MRHFFFFSRDDRPAQPRKLLRVEAQACPLLNN